MDEADLPRQLKTIRRRLHRLDQGSEQFANLIRVLWRTQSFAGSYSGVSNFKHALNYEIGIDLSLKKIRQILSGIKTFTTFMRISKNIKTRHYFIHGSFILWQSDVVTLWPYGDWRYVLLCVDTFSLRSFARKLKTRSAEEVKEAFIEIFKEAGGIPESLQTDQVKI